VKAYKIIQNKKHFTSNNYGFYSVFHQNFTAKRVPKLQFMQSSSVALVVATQFPILTVQ